MPTLPEILKTKIGKGSKSKAYVASTLGISEKTVENYMNGKRQPKPARLVKLAEILAFSLSDLTEVSEQNVPYETGIIKQEPLNGVEIKEESGINRKILFNLTEGNRIQSETNQTVAITNEKLVDQNIKLTQSFTERADQKTFEETVAMVKGLREYIIGLAAQLTKSPPHEILQVLNSKVKSAMSEGEKKGTPSGAGK